MTKLIKGVVNELPPWCSLCPFCSHGYDGHTPYCIALNRKLDDLCYSDIEPPDIDPDCPLELDDAE